VILLSLAGLVFVRTTYVYPSRMPTLRLVTLAAGSVWGAMLLWVIWNLPERSPGVLLASLAFPAYYAVLSGVLHRRRRHATGARPGGGQFDPPRER
jgi:hypothetical protein